MSAYAVMLLGKLKKELRDEQRGHAETRKRLIETSAKLALREAELGACITHVDHASLLPSCSHRSEGYANNAGFRRNHRMSDERALDILHATSSSNRMLETEVEWLIDRVRSFCHDACEARIKLTILIIFQFNHLEKTPRDSKTWQPGPNRPRHETAPCVPGRTGPQGSQAALEQDIKLFGAAIDGVVQERQAFSEPQADDPWTSRMSDQLSVTEVPIRQGGLK